MRKLLLGLFLGLLAVVHSTPVTSVTQVPVNNEDDVFREAMTDGFIVLSLTTETPKTQSTIEASQHFESTSNADDVSRDFVLTTEVSKTNATVPASQQPDFEDIEGSAEGVTNNFWHGGYMTTTSTQEASSATESTTSMQEALGATESTTTTSMQEALGATESMTSGFDPNELPAETTTVKASQQPFSDDMSEGSAMGDSEDMSTTFPWFGSSTTTTSTSTDSPVSSLSTDFGSGDEELVLPATVNTLGSGLGSGMIEEPAVSKTGKVQLVNMEKPAMVVETQDPEQHKGHTTPGWIIIVGFIVGVAALVLLCLAIATRDKWNGPSQASTTKTETNPSNQQKGLEMETFLPREEPMENGKAAEYTVIPLDELSESYS
ncbi:uncharacterized protein LOC110957808 [Acanthochromis polyacanthus]|uniref:uncharacterized protein LOC110957808 n=1 Tax=Acanthochromis polyacanthus TaxID=80966 RepID=UPI002233E42A|nr:uncharacterized protein LOC110957808 [Acanthochromis polyacanthus]